ncbi:MAG: septation protein IspZ [Candidatus Andeanibacterium colombiense]|uniref:Inner membrane-spanning protein YciB n=1 Tax=Candidatus Andeanibacterium colombiense TaxID=3121345 RepID=A0AAJ5X695_9SPHN|nr:MAG: septation protein IspZ [Sphingomonadaceae bacterium]
MNAPAPQAKKPGNAWISLLIDYAPLLVFLGSYWWFAPKGEHEGIGVIVAVTKSTAAFVVASIAALAISRWRFGKISRMLWLSTIMVVGFGALTILFRDPEFIQVKPTVLYLFFGTVLLVGWWRGKALLQWLLEAAFEGLDDDGWLKLSRNWGFFFFALAVLNELLRLKFNAENGGFGTWLAIKVPVFAGLSFLFTFSQLPMLLKHGLATEAKVEEETTLPPQ